MEPCCKECPVKTFSRTPAPGESSRIIPCPVCGGLEFRPRWTLGSSRFVSCRSCSLVLQNPRPLSGDLAARYDEEYFQYEIANEDAFLNLMLQGLNDADFFKHIVPSLPRPLSILDTGCATGRLLAFFKEKGWETAGAELCQASAEYGNRRHGVNIRPVSLEDAAFPAREFSVVHASHLIEHVFDPAGFTAEVFRVLKPGGIFICVTPAIDGFQARLFREKWRSLIEDHVTLFSRKTLGRLLVQEGFTIEKMCSWGGLAAGSAPAFIKKPVDVLAKKWNFGDVILMAARKTAED